MAPRENNMAVKKFAYTQKQNTLIFVTLLSTTDSFGASGCQLSNNLLIIISAIVTASVDTKVQIQTHVSKGLIMDS